MRTEWRQWIEATLDERVVSSTALLGSTTATVLLIVTEVGEVVLKAFSLPFFLEEDPARATHEAEGLLTAEAAAVPAPRLIAVDPDGSSAGVPAVLMTGASGTPVSPPPSGSAWLDAIDPLHRCNVSPARTFQRYNPPGTQSVPPWASDRPLWLEAFRLVGEGGPDTPVGPIHRDFHNGNLLWSGGEVTAIVDWLSFCRGPIDIDGARYVLDLELNGHREAALQADATWTERHGRSLHPYWRLVDALDALPYYDGVKAVEAWGSPERRAAVERFIADAVG